MLLYPNLRVYEFDVDFIIKEKILDYLIKKHLFLKQNWVNYQVQGQGPFNFKIDSYEEHFNLLYTLFFNTSQRVFGPLTLTNKNKNCCWAYVTNCEDNSGIHNHIKTSIINCVYYAKIPKHSACNLNFYKNDKIVASHKPREKTFVIFPGFLDHAPEIGSDQRYRISINMEICCYEDVWVGCDN